MKKVFLIMSTVFLCLILVSCGTKENHVGEANTPSGSSVMKGSDYKSVLESFTEAGFTNVKLEKIEDLITGWLTKDGEVEEVSVGGDVDYAPDMWVPADTAVIIRYHTFPTENLASDPIPENTPTRESKAESVATDPIPENTPTQESQALSVEGTIEGTEQSDEILTTENCEELAAILLNKDEPYDSYSNFATKYEGRTIDFDGRIDYLVNHENYNTRYDILLSAGDYDPNTQIGPTFKFEDVGLWDLGLDSLSISVGMNVRIVATVQEFNYNTGIFFLDPISVIER